MSIRRLILLAATSLSCSNLFAQDFYDLNFHKVDPQLISYKLVDTKDSDWINVANNLDKNHFTWSATTTDTLSEEIALAWNLTNSLSVNLNVFENKHTTQSISTVTNTFFNKSSGINKFMPVQQASDDINRRLSGYKFGLSSQLGIGKNYKLGINLDYGQLDGADLAGFTNHEINTSSFELGIRNQRFGASFNTDIFLEKDVDIIQNSRLGLEFDWYFSEDTVFSVGSKQRLNNNQNQANYLDSLTGNVQYIKFQHNL